jgi:GT2 family glycosyltransferase
MAEAASDSSDARWSPCSLAVQIVLYDNSVADQLRLAQGLSAAISFLRAASDLDHVAVRYGDCSRWPCLTEHDEGALRAALGDSVDEVTFTYFAANLGSGGGSNALARLGNEDAIWVLNPDTYPSPTAAAELLKGLRTDGVGATEARQIPIEHQKRYDKNTGETGWGSGFCLMLRREAFDEVGGFDSHFFPLYCDDVDLSWRLRAAGWTIRHVPRAVVVHDKPLAEDGSVRWSEQAARSSHLARLWLYRRYGRPDLEKEFLGGIDPHLDPVAADAVDDFLQRGADGDFPEVLEGAGNVAEFIDGQYSPRRFSYAG